MKSMKMIGLIMMSAFSFILVGCGGDKGGPAPQPGGVPPVNAWPMGTAMTQPYVCPSNMIQLRNSFGRPQCFNTTDIAQACAQARGILVQGHLCRAERQIPGRVSYRLMNRRGYTPSRVPLIASLYAGEALKVYGTIDSGNEDLRWDAQLLQNGAVVGSTSSDMPDNGTGQNFEIIAMTMMNMMTPGTTPVTTPGTYPGYPAGQCPTGYVWSNNQCLPNGQTPTYGGYGYNQGTYGGYAQAGYGTYGYGYSTMTQMPSSQMFSLDLMFQGSVRINLRASAISCEDGHGNSYPCQ